MTISEAIKELEQIQAVRGDLNLFILGKNFSVRAVQFIAYMCSTENDRGMVVMAPENPTVT